ncbi:MAG: tetratricopeptide repeat protein [Planctomycetota bacterium]
MRGNSGALYALGDLLMTEGRAEEALPYLEQAEAAEPRGVENKARRIAIRTRHGACLLALGRASEARAAYGRALSSMKPIPRPWRARCRPRGSCPRPNGMPR